MGRLVHELGRLVHHLGRILTSVFYLFILLMGRLVHTGGGLLMQKNELIEKVKANRQQIVAQSNEFIRRVPPIKLDEQEAKLVYFMASKIRPDDKDFMKVKIRIEELCATCGIDTRNGKNYSDMKNTLKKLSDKSAWHDIIRDGKTGKQLIRWIDTYLMIDGSGEIEATFSQGMKPFLLELISRGHFTQAKLLNFLALKSKYSQRLYEILKSYTYSDPKRAYAVVIEKIEIAELKKMLNAENYELFKDFRVRVLDIAMRQINAVTDLKVSYTPIKSGRMTTHIQFDMQFKEPLDRLRADEAAERLLDE